MILRPPVFFLPDFKEREGLPFFPLSPGLVFLGFRDNEGFFGGEGKALSASVDAEKEGSGGSSSEGAGGGASETGSSGISPPVEGGAIGGNSGMELT